MTSIQRYVVAEILKVFVAALVAIALLMTLGSGAKEGVRKGLPVVVVLQLLPYILPEILRFAIPGSLLFAVCTVFGRMSAAEEITALKALGISPTRIVMPVLVIAYAFSLTTFWLYEVCAFWSRPNVARVAVGCVDLLAYNALHTDGVFQAGGVTVMAKTAPAKQLLDLKIVARRPGDETPFILAAHEAELLNNATTGKLRVRCRQGHIELPGEGLLMFPDEFEQEIEIHPPLQLNADTASPAELRLSTIVQQIGRERTRVERLEADLPTTAAAADGLQRHRARLFRLQAEPQRRLSNGFAVFAFAMIGIPVAIWRHSANNFSAFFVCFAPIAAIYYPFLVVGEEIARKGFFPQLSVWLATAMLMLAGALLLRRLVR